MRRIPIANRRQILKGAVGAAGAVTMRSVTGRSASAQTVKLVNVQHDSRPLDNAAYEAVYEVFRQQHPEIEIEFQTIPWEQARSKMLTLGQADSLPDMGRMQWPADYAAADMIIPLDDMVDEATLARFNPLIVETGSAVGNDGERHLYTLPWFQGAAAILVNKTYFDQAGLPLKDEWTTDEFTEYAKALTVEGDHWGVALDVAGVGDPVSNFLLAVYAYGGRWVAGDPENPEPEPITFDSPETVDGITWYSNLFLDGYAVPSAPTDTYKERDANFQSGKAAIEWQGPWSLLEIQENFEKGGYELASMPLPKGPGGNPNWYGGAYASIYRSAVEREVVDEAFSWISFLSSDEGEKLYCKTNGMIPASNSALEDPFWSENDLYKGYLNSFEGISRMDPIWATGLTSILDDTVPPLLQGVFNRQLSPEEMASQVQDEVIEGLRRNGVDVPEN